MAKLGEICTFQSGGTPSKSNSAFFGGDIPWITTVALNGNVIGNEKAVEWITDEAIQKSAAKIVPANSIMVGTRVGIGKVAINTVQMSTSQDIVSLINIDSERWDKGFLCKFLLAKNEFLMSQARGATIKGIKIETLADLDIPELTLENQRRIAAILDKVNDLIDKRRAQLEKLDLLVKSRFVEMFENNNYPLEPLANNVIEMFIGPFGSSLKNEFFVDKEDGFCMVYEQKHAIQKTMDVPTRYVSKSKYEELKRFSVIGGDIIVSCRGTIGEIYIVPDDAPLGIMHPSIMKIRLNTERYNQKYFVFALEQYMAEHNAEANGSGVKMAVSATVLGKADFAVPPIDLQNQFAALIEQTNKSKLTIQQSLDKLEILNKALMQHYFG